MSLKSDYSLENIFYSDNFPFVVSEVDKKRIIKNINKVLPGYKRENVINTLSDSYIITQQLPIHIRAINRAIKTKQPQKYTIDVFTNDKTEVWYETHVIPKIKNGKAIGAYLLGYEITDAVKAKLNVKNKELQLEIIFQQLPISIFTIDKNKKITSLTGPGIKNVVENYIGQKIELILKGDAEQKNILKTIDKALKGKKSIIERYTQGRVFQLYIEPLKNTSGKIEGAIGVSVDITEKYKADQKIKENEERLKALTDSAFEGIVFSENGVIIDANEQFAKIHGYKNAKEIIGLKIIDDFVVPEMRKTAMEYKRGLRKGAYELITKKKDGSRVFLESKGKEISFKNRKIRVTVAYDITKRKLGELALFESERTLSTLMGNLPGMAYRCLYDKSWTMLFVSNGCKKLTGYSQAEIVLNKKVAFADLVLPADRLVGKQEIETALKKNGHFEIQYRIVDKHKKIKWIWEKGRGIYDTNGKLLFIEGFIADITDSKSQETALNQNRGLYENLVEQSPQGTFIHDAKGKILYANKATLEILKIKKLNKVKNNSMFDWILPEYHSQIINDKKRLKEGRTIEFKLSKIRAEDGSIIDVEYRPINFLYNNLPSVLVVFHDISMERKLNEQKLRVQVAETANVKLQKQIIERKAAEAKLLHSLKEKEVLLKEVHHRVKNNLQVISSILNLQSSYINDEQIQSVLKESQNRIKSMAFIHESLYQTKDFSGIKFSDYIINLSNNLVHAYISSGKAIKLHLDIKDVFLNLDLAIPCGLILNELISNALKHAFGPNDKGNIYVGLNQEDEKIEISVRDNGRGFPEGFDYKNTQTLGLQLVVALADQLNGKIEFRANGGVSCTVTFKQQKINKQ